MISEANRLPQANITKRRKAVKLLSVLIAVFFLCWCLFFMYFFLAAIILKTLSKDKLASIAVLIALCNTKLILLPMHLKGTHSGKDSKQHFDKWRQLLL